MRVFLVLGGAAAGLVCFAWAGSGPAVGPHEFLPASRGPWFEPGPPPSVRIEALPPSPRLRGRAPAASAPPLRGTPPGRESPELERAAAVLADMTRDGTDLERRWAASELSSAPPPLARAVGVLLDRTDGAPPVPPARAESAAATAVRVRIEVRLLAAVPELLRDLGIDLRDLDGTGWPGPGGRSVRTWLDDTQIEVLLRCAERRPELLRTLDSAEVRIDPLETLHLGLARDTVLTLRAVVSADLRFATLDVRVRSMRRQGLVFAPRLGETVPDGGTLLLCPRDPVDPERHSDGDDRLLLLTVEVPSQG